MFKVEVCRLSPLARIEFLSLPSPLKSHYIHPHNLSYNRNNSLTYILGPWWGSCVFLRSVSIRLQNYTVPQFRWSQFEKSPPRILQIYLILFSFFNCINLNVFWGVIQCSLVHRYLRKVKLILKKLEHRKLLLVSHFWNSRNFIEVNQKWRYIYCLFNVYSAFWNI